jgi:hypothetical protein
MIKEKLENLYMKGLLAGFVLAVILTVPVFAQAPIDILIIDETETLLESIAVNIIAAMLRQETELFGQVDAIISTVDSPFDLPVRENTMNRSYDLVIIAPKGVLDLKQIWLVTPTYIEQLPELSAAIDFLSGLAEQLSGQFEFEANLLNVSHDLFIGILAGYFCQLGILTHA